MIIIIRYVERDINDEQVVGWCQQEDDFKREKTNILQTVWV